jgi:hypothetical protein
MTLTPPAYVTHPPVVGSRVDVVRDFSKLYGRELDEEQLVAVECLTGFDAEGRWAALEGAIVQPRQNGKTSGVMTAITLTDLFLFKPDRIAWTAHLFKTSRSTFEDITNLIGMTPELSRRVKRIRHAAGDEGIELVTGARLDFLARSKGGGRGLGGKRVVVDEALFFTDAQAGALLPVLSARANPTILYGSSAAVLESDYLRSLRDRGRAGDESLAWVEWCASGSLVEPPCTGGKRCQHAVGTDGCVLDDVAYWQSANPALGRRIRTDTLKALRASLSPLDFAREFLGWHEDPEGAQNKIAMSRWTSAVDARSEITGIPSFAVDVAPDRESAAIAVAGVRSDKRVHVGLVEHRAGLDWVAPRLVELWERHGPSAIYLDAQSPAASLLPALQAELVEVEALTIGKLGAACGLLADAVNSEPPTLRHRGDPIVTAALAGAAIRDVGDGAWAWRRKDSEQDICPLVALTIAHYAHASQMVIAEDFMSTFG